MTKVIRRTNPWQRAIQHAAPSLATVAARLPTKREVGADYHWLLGSDNPNNECQVTGKRLHPNVRGYITDGGSGWTVAPTIALGGGSSAYALLTPSYIWTATIGSGGSGYPAASSCTVSVTGGTYAAGGYAPRFRVVTVNAGVVTSVAMLDPGSGILTVPTVTIVGSGGSGGTITVALTSGVKTIAVTNGGSGYTSPPSVSVTGGTSGTALAARAIAVVSGGAVTAVHLLDGGYGYTSTPTISFASGGGSGAAATATTGTNIVRAIIITDPGIQTAGGSATITGGDGSGATGGFIMAGGTYTRSANSLTIPAGGNLDNTAQNGLVMPVMDEGEFTMLVVAKMITGANSQLVMGTATNAGSTTAGFEIKHTSSAYSVLDFNLQATAAALSTPAGASSGGWIQFVHACAPVAGESVTPSAETVQSSAFYTRIGTATAVNVTSGERKTLTRPRMLGVGNCYQVGVTWRVALEIAEVILFKRKLTTAEIDAVRTRSAARLAARGVTVVNT